MEDDENTLTDDNTSDAVELQEDVTNFIPDAHAINNLQGMGDVQLDLRVILGRIDIPMNQFLKLGRGAIIELDKPIDALVDMEVNGHCVGKGDITVVDETVAIIISELGKKKSFSAPPLDDMASAMAEMGVSEADMAAAMGDEMDMAAAMEGMDEGGDDEMDMAALMAEMDGEDG